MSSISITGVFRQLLGERWDKPWFASKSDHPIIFERAVGQPIAIDTRYLSFYTPRAGEQNLITFEGRPKRETVQ
jgi:hypothetical protein